MFLEFARDFEGLRDLDTSLETVLHIVLYYQGHIVAGRCFAHLIHTEVHKAHPVLQAAAELIVAVVGVRREELRDEVAVAGVQLDGIDARFVSDVNRFAEVLYDFVNLAAAQPSDESRRIEVEAGRSSHRELACGEPVGHIAAVAYLDADGRAFCVDGVGHIAHRRDNLVTQPELAVEGDGAAVDCRVGERGHRYSASCDAYVVVLEFLCRRKILSHRLEGRAADNPVLELEWTELERSEKYRIFSIVCHFYVN